MIQTISSLLCEPIPFNDPILKITLNVTVSKDGNYAFSKFSNEKGDFITVNVHPRIVFRYIVKDAQWDTHHQIVITQRNIFSLRLAFRKFYKTFQREDLYRYDDYGRVTEIVSDNNDILIIPLTMGQLMRLEPTVITDTKNRIYPGVLMTINKEENQVPLTIDEFESIYELIQSINIYQAGMTLLQTYIGMRKTPVEETMKSYEEREVPKTNKYRSNKSLFDKPINSENTEDGMVSGMILPKKPDSLDDL